MEEFLGSRQKRAGDVPVSWAIFREEEKPFWYARPCYIWLYSTLVFLPSKTFRDGRMGQQRPRRKYRQQQNSVCSLGAQLACKIQCLEREPVEKSYLQQILEQEQAVLFPTELTCVHGTASTSEHEIIYSGLFSRVGSSCFTWEKCLSEADF